MNIGVMGYYGFGNLGDEMLLNTIRRFLAPHRVIAFPIAFLPTEDALDRLNSFDYLILGGGGLFNRTPTPPFDTFDQWAPRLQMPISVLGLGVEQLDSRFMPAAHRLVEQADFFIVRDAESERLIGHPKVRVAPDLTFYQPLSCSQFNERGQELVCGVNLRPLHRGVNEWIQTISALPGRKRALPFSLVPTHDDREPLAQIVSSCSDQASLTAYGHLDVVVGTAFHSIVFAVQAGIPAIAINYHPKVRRLMEELGLGNFVLEWDESQRLPACFEKALADRDMIRVRMLDYTRHAQQTLTSVLAGVRSAIEMRASANKTDSPSVVTEPSVTVWVLCRNASDADIATTLTSCRNQTYSQLDLVLVDYPDNRRIGQIAPSGPQALRHIATPGSDLGKNDLFVGSGEYVTWVAAGAWFAEDALALLVQSLVNQPAAVLVHSNYFITSNGNIDRKIELRPLTPAGSLPVGPCFLAHRDVVATLWYTQGAADRSLLGQRTAHLSQPLFYKPATASEHSIYLATIAYGRGQLEAAQDFLSRAIREDPILAQRRPAFEQAFRAFLAAAFNQLAPVDPITYLKDTCAALPTATRNERIFARWFAGRANLEMAFMHYQQGKRNQTRDSLVLAFRQDLALLSNRGALWQLGETVVGTGTIERLQRMRNRWRHRL